MGWSHHARTVLLCFLLVLVGCSGETDISEPPAPGEPLPPEVQEMVAREVANIEAAATRIDSIFRPLPLLSSAEESNLRQFGNARQLAVARQLGIDRGATEEQIDRLLQQGELVELEDNEHFIVRDLDHSRALAIPEVRDLLNEIGTRFQSRLAELGAPPLRLEVTSVLRSAADQARLRQVNPNAAAGTSTHEFGTTIDIAYNAFSAPQEPYVAIGEDVPEWLRPHVRRFADVVLERVAARRSAELKAVLGEVLLEMQREGKAMVTLERQQPVYHMTVRG